LGGNCAGKGGEQLFRAQVPGGGGGVTEENTGGQGWVFGEDQARTVRGGVQIHQRAGGKKKNLNLKRMKEGTCAGVERCRGEGGKGKGGGELDQKECSITVMGGKWWEW